MNLHSPSPAPRWTPDPGDCAADATTYPTPSLRIHECLPSPKGEAADGQAGAPARSAPADAPHGAGKKDRGGDRPPLAAVPAPDDAREALLVRLLFAARRLARRATAGVGGQDFCAHCVMAGAEHAEACPAGEVLGLIEQLQRTAPRPLAFERRCEGFGEPWALDPENTGCAVDRYGFGVYDADGATEIYADQMERFARRVVACVNVCAGAKTEDLEAIAAVADMDVRSGWREHFAGWVEAFAQKGGAR